MGGLGALLVVSLFLPWYRACASEACESGPAASAWEVFAVVDAVLLVAGLVAVVALVLTVAHQTPAVPLALTAIGTLAALVAAILVIARLVATPDLPGGADEAGAVPVLGAWIGAVASLGLLAAMMASIRDERTPAPSRALQEQAEAVRTLPLSSADGQSPASPSPRAGGPT